MRIFIFTSVVLFVPSTYALNDFDKNILAVFEDSSFFSERFLQEKKTEFIFLDYQILDDQMLAIEVLMIYKNEFHLGPFLKLTLIYSRKKNLKESDYNSKLSESFEFVGLRWDQLPN